MIKTRSSLWVGLFCVGVMAASCGGSSTTIGDGGTDGSVGNDGNPTTNPDGSITGPACTSDAQCAFPTPYCDTAAQVCVQCLGDPNCADPQFPVCNTTTNQCVECLVNTDCQDPQQPICFPGNNRCVDCCSSQCDSQTCSVEQTSCRRTAEACGTNGDCCSGICNMTTQRCDLGPGPCREPATPCIADTDCCRGSCVPNAQGIPVCTAACLADGADCNSAGDCCSGTCGGLPSRCGPPMVCPSGG